MANVPKRVAVIGLDAAILPLIEKHTAEGYLPTFKKLMERGVLAENCLAPFPTITPPNWTAIATGAFGGTNGVTDFHYHQSGSPLDNRYIIQDWNSGRVLAETIWEALDKAGKKCIVLNYPCSWPPK
jgi:predicted AlkP superfamily phosphohydrolase/phosphomutase